MKTRNEVTEIVNEVVRRHVEKQAGAVGANDGRLPDLLDSLDMVELLAEVEERLALDLKPDDFSDEDFNSATKFVAAVLRIAFKNR